MGWWKRGERKLRTEGTNAAQAVLPHLPPSWPCHNRGPAPELSEVWYMKACFLPFSTIEPFTPRCFYSDRGALPLSCADRPKKSHWVLLVQRGKINTSRGKHTDKLTPNCLKCPSTFFHRVHRKCSISPSTTFELWTGTQSQWLSPFWARFSVARSRMCLPAIWPLSGSTVLMLWLFTTTFPLANAIVFQSLRWRCLYYCWISVRWWYFFPSDEKHIDTFKVVWSSSYLPAI